MTIANERTDEPLVLADPEPVEVVLPARAHKVKRQRQDAQVAKAIADAQAQGFTVVSARKVKKNLWELVLEPAGQHHAEMRLADAPEGTEIALDDSAEVTLDGAGSAGSGIADVVALGAVDGVTLALSLPTDGGIAELPDAAPADVTTADPPFLDAVEAALSASGTLEPDGAAMATVALGAIDDLDEVDVAADAPPLVVDEVEQIAPEGFEPEVSLPTSVASGDSDDHEVEITSSTALPLPELDDVEPVVVGAPEPPTEIATSLDPLTSDDHAAADSDDQPMSDDALQPLHGIFGQEQALAHEDEEPTVENERQSLISIDSLEDDGDDADFAALLASAEAIVQSSASELHPAAPSSINGDDEQVVDRETTTSSLEDDEFRWSEHDNLESTSSLSDAPPVARDVEAPAQHIEGVDVVPGALAPGREDGSTVLGDHVGGDGASGSFADRGDNGGDADHLHLVEAAASDEVGNGAIDASSVAAPGGSPEAIPSTTIAPSAGDPELPDDHAARRGDPPLNRGIDDGASRASSTPPELAGDDSPMVPVAVTGTTPGWDAPEDSSAAESETDGTALADPGTPPPTDERVIDERLVSPSVRLAAQFAQPKKSRFGRNRKDKATGSMPKSALRQPVPSPALSQGEDDAPRPLIAIDPRTGRPVQQLPGAEQSTADRSPALTAAISTPTSSSSVPQRVATPIQDHLVAQGIATGEHLDEAHRRMLKVGGTLLESLVANQVVNADVLTDAIAAFSNLPVTDLSHERLDADALDLVPEEVAREHMVFPMRVLPDALVVACAEPNERIMGLLAQASGLRVEASVARSSDIRSAIDRNYHALSGVAEIVEEFEADQVPRRRTAAVANQEADPENAPIVRVVNRILSQAMREGASDIHIEPADDIVRVRNRVDGVLKVVLVLPASMGLGLVSRIKIMAEMNIVERRRPQDGMFTATVDGRALDVRVATVATIWGEACVLRLLDKSKSLLSIAELGMATDTHATYSKLIRAPFGMVLCVGPTGSGKTTTLYASLTEISDTARNVMTIEDPVEYVFPSINQIQTNEQAGLTFATGLKSILRQDSDVVLVGEIRDVETARIAIQSTLTGHFVLSSVHATDAIGALTRFIDMGIESFLIASSVIGLVGQRLVRQICESCKERYDPTDEELEFYRSAGGPEKTAFYRGAGCNSCGHTGFKGRVGIYELVPMTPELKREIVAGAKEEELRALARSQGVRSMRDEAIALISRDATTAAEVIRSIYAI